VATRARRQGCPRRRHDGESRQEQGSLGLDRLSEAEFARFERLNADYAARFGMPFIICVRRPTRDSDPATFEAASGQCPPGERAAAMEEIGTSTRLRLVEAVQGPGTPKTEGRLPPTCWIPCP